MLDNIRKNRIKSSIVITIATFIAAMIIWPLFDFLWAIIITHNEFTYNVKDYLLEPAIFATVFGILAYAIWKPETKFDKKTEKNSKN